MRIARRPAVPAALLAAAALCVSVLAVPAATVSAAEVAAVEGSPNGPDPYFPRDGNGGYQVRHYAIDDRYVPRTDRLVGRTSLTAVAGPEALSAFHLDLRLTPDSVSVNGATARFAKVTGHELRVVPASVLPAGERFRVTVRYHGYPSRLGGASIWDGYFHGPGEAAAVGEPQIGPWWFAANETPGDKATFDITIRVPRGQQAVSNGRLVSRTTTADWTAWHWRLAQPISTYLAFFVAGRFELRSRVVDDRRYLYAASRTLSDSQRERSFRLLGQTPRVLGWLERRFGPYPYANDAGGVMSAVYTGFALENASRPFYSWAGGPGSLDLVVHELAHQWFGDTVALERWRDTWLNEGFATYVEWLWSESHDGQTVDDLLHETYNHASGDFWTLKISDPGPDDIFSSPIYERGGMMLAALRCRVGGTAMRGLTRAWVDQHRGGTGTGTQFRALAEERSGQDLDAFFQQWLDDTTKPDATLENGLGECLA